MKTKFSYAVYEVVNCVSLINGQLYVFNTYEANSHNIQNRLRTVKRISNYASKKAVERKVWEIKRKLKEIEILNKLGGRTCKR